MNASEPREDAVAMLPPLPEPDFNQSIFLNGKCVAPSYTAEQMHAYAIAALAQRGGGTRGVGQQERLHVQGWLARNNTDPVRRRWSAPMNAQLRFEELAGWSDDDWAVLFAHRPDLKQRLIAALAAPKEAGDAPDGSVLVNRHGLIVHFAPRVREFFGAIIDDGAYIHDADDIAKRDREYAGDAPHRQAFVYARLAAPSKEAGADASWTATLPDGRVVRTSDNINWTEEAAAPQADQQGDADKVIRRLWSYMGPKTPPCCEGCNAEWDMAIAEMKRYLGSDVYPAAKPSDQQGASLEGEDDPVDGVFRTMPDSATLDDYLLQLAQGKLTAVDQMAFDNMLHDHLAALASKASPDDQRQEGCPCSYKDCRNKAQPASPPTEAAAAVGEVDDAMVARYCEAVGYAKPWPPYIRTGLLAALSPTASAAREGK